jgi:DNA ligase (NAD+)
LSIMWIGPKVAQSVQKFFHEPHNKKVLEKLLKKVKIFVPKPKQGKFSSQQIVITWSVEWISRDEIAKFIEDNQWEFSNQVTQHTTLLLVGDKPWKSKLEKAKKYNIPTYDLKKFLEENWFNIKNKPQQMGLF